MAGRLARVMHRTHRTLGSALALLVAVWCASGVVMTFSDYPRFSESERLARQERLRADQGVAVPPELRGWIAQGGLSRGERARLSVIEGRPTWVFADASGERRALRAHPPWTLAPLDPNRAARVAESSFAASARNVVRLAEPDQWTVALWKPATAPVFRVQLDGSLAREVYVAAGTGEIVQESTRRERLLAWLGAIPHWIYPASLRRSRDVWRVVVLSLATFALVASLSGLVVGLDVHRVLRNRRGTRLRRLRDRTLRWHHRLGLLFGVAISTWLFSGILSLTPFDWSRAPELSSADQAQLHGVTPGERDLPIAEIVARCAAELPGLRELELAALAGKLHAVCTDDVGQTRVVDTTDAALSPRRALAAADFLHLVPSRRVEDVDIEQSYDAYHYPTHRDPKAALPYVRIERGTQTLYLDPARARLIAVHTRESRLTRWLYHGLHSLDLPGLYQRRAVWRATVIGALTIATSVAVLGLVLTWRRAVRAFRRRTLGRVVRGGPT